MKRYSAEEKLEKILYIESIYYSKKKKMAEIAEEVGVNRTTIFRWLESHAPERYKEFKSASGKKNKKEHLSKEERKVLAEKMLKEQSEGVKIKDIAKKYGCSASYVSILIKKYCTEQYEKVKEQKEKERVEKTRKRKEREKLRKEENQRIEFWLKKQQAQNAIAMSFRKRLSDYDMVLLHIHFYTEKNNIYELKSEVLSQMSYAMPRKYAHKAA